MYHPEDVPYKLDMSDLPDTFTPARHKVSDTDMSHLRSNCGCILCCCIMFRLLMLRLVSFRIML